MGRFKHILNVCLIAAAIAVSFRGCKHHQDSTAEQAMSPVLQKDENEKITVDIKAGRIEQTTRRAPDALRQANNSPTVARNLDGARKLAITVKDDGRIEVYAQRSGFILEPGIGLVYEEKTRLSLDAQIFFVRRYGLNAGLSYPLRGDGGGRLFVAGSYNFYRNSCLLVGLDNKKDPVIGIRISF